MSYCIKCGKEIEENFAFCAGCGAPVKKEVPTTPLQIEVTDPPTQFQTFNENPHTEEIEFLDNTHKLLRWERKAWSIASKFCIITGIVYAVIFSLYILLGIAMSSQDYFLGGIFAGLGIFASVFGGGTFIAFGIISKKAAEKLLQYIETLYTDLSISYKRCSNVGMLVFNIIFGIVSPIFFIINFVRMKSNRELIERIIKNQNAHR